MGEDVVQHFVVDGSHDNMILYLICSIVLQRTIGGYCSFKTSEESE